MIVSQGQVDPEDLILRGFADYRTADGSTVRAEFAILPLAMGATTTTGTVIWGQGTKRLKHIQGQTDVMITATGPNTVISLHSGHISY